MIEIININIFLKTKLEEDDDTLKNDAHYTMPNQDLQIFIVILVIDVVVSSIRSSSCFNIDVPGNNNNKTSTMIVLFCLLT